MPREQRERIFERFAATARGLGGGPGLGLYVARETIGVIDRSGKGARFWIELPAAQ